MLKEDYCSFEVAKLLKEKGFDESCYQKYDSDGELFFNHVGYINSEKPCEDFYALAPTLQMVMKWLREVHKVLIVIDAYHADHWEGYIDSFEISIYSHASTIIVPDEIVHHTDYTEAIEASLKFCLENLI